MALSPGVYTKETDLTFNIQSITANASGFAGLFTWGPVNEVVDITTNEAELVRRFGIPTPDVSGFFHAAANYLAYSVPLSIVRATGNGALNAQTADAVTDDETPVPLPGIMVRNTDHYKIVDLTGYSIIGKYPGSYVNGVKISMANAAGQTTWDYADQFLYKPTNDDTYNVIVIDTTGNISGTAGSILERFELMQLVPGAKKTDGTSAYLVDAIENQSNYILIGDTDKIVPVSGIYEQTLEGGADDNVAATADFMTAWTTFESKEQVEILRVFTSFSPDTAKIKAIDIVESRQDAIAFNAPPLDAVFNTSNVVANLEEYFGSTLNRASSYAFNVDNWKLVRDKYNDANIWIPTDSDAAGLHARTFTESEAWFSPAGFNRGQLKNTIKLAWSSNEKQRDVLYPLGINSIVAFKGEGTVLFGDRTALQVPSAFSRINVRTLFIVIKKAIAQASRALLFELNDYITQALFRNATNQYLTDVKGRRGVYDFKVICDSTNNTPQVVDSNEFVGDIYVKPSRSINFIHLNFIAVGTGVDFTEFEGA